MGCKQCLLPLAFSEKAVSLICSIKLYPHQSLGKHQLMTGTVKRQFFVSAVVVAGTVVVTVVVTKSVSSTATLPSVVFAHRREGLNTKLKPRGTVPPRCPVLPTSASKKSAFAYLTVTALCFCSALRANGSCGLSALVPSFIAANVTDPSAAFFVMLITFPFVT